MIFFSKNKYSQNTLKVFFASIFILISLMSLAGSFLPLGQGENYYFYNKYGLTRKEVFFIGFLNFLFLIILLKLNFFIFYTKRLGLNILLSIMAFLTSFLLAEISLRWIDKVPIVATNNWLAERTALLTTQTLNDYDPLLGWVLKSNISEAGEDPANSFTTTSYGIRSNSPKIRKITTDGILTSGDSFTAGSEVGDSSTWPSQLEKMLGSSVINAGTGGWGSDQIILRAEALIPILKPNFVVISFLDDDINRAGYRVYGGANKPWFSIEEGELVHHNNPVPRFSGKLSETSFANSIVGHSWLLLKLTDVLGISGWQLFRESYIKAPNNSIAVSCLLLRRAKQVFEHHKIPWLFVMQYGGNINQSNAVKPANARAVIECAERDGVAVLDLWDDLSEIQRQSRQMYIDLFVSYDGLYSFGHMSSIGNKFVAERIFHQIKKLE